jgi:hypothetical protein
VRDTILGVKRILPILAAGLASFLMGCATEPAATTPAETIPDPGLEVVRPTAPSFDPPPPPSVRLVDLRKLRVGMTMEEVLAVFPGPDQTRISPRDTVVWRYPFAELYFGDGRLYNWFDLEREY